MPDRPEPDRGVRKPERVPPAPLDPPMVPFVLAGTGVWVVVGVVLLIARAPSGWLWTCLAGVLVGLVALPVLVVHDRRRPGAAEKRRRRPTAS